MAPKHNHSPWRKVILVPLWTVQLLFLAIMIVILAASIKAISSGDEGRISWGSNTIASNDEVVDKTIHIIVWIWLAVCSVCLILTVTEIVLLFRHSLKPLVLIVLNVVKAGTWTVVFVFEMIYISTVNVQNPTVLGILIDVIPLVAFWIPFIYGIIVWRNLRRTRGAYIPVETPKPSETYPPQYKNFIVEDNIAVEPTRPPGARRLSYNHTRDTRFERFNTERRSLSNPSIALGNDVVIVGNGSVPSVKIGDYDSDAFEMDRPR